MISIQKNDPVEGFPDLFVLSPSGEYQETDLIECYSQDNPGVSTCAFAAQFVKFGNMVYQQEQPLNENQVAALEANAPIDEVINNEALVDGKIDPMSLSQDAPEEVARPTPKKKVQPVEPEPAEELIPEPEVEPVPVVDTEPTPEVTQPEPQVGDMVGENYDGTN